MTIGEQCKWCRGEGIGDCSPRCVHCGGTGYTPCAGVAHAPAGTKHDTGKAPWHLLPFDAVDQVVAVLRAGAEKYAPRNWEGGRAYSHDFSAALRHLTAWWEGENADPQSGLHPLAHAACDVLFLLAFVVRGRTDLDDRPKGAP